MIPTYIFARRGNDLTASSNEIWSEILLYAEFLLINLSIAQNRDFLAMARCKIHPLARSYIAQAVRLAYLS
jgi:hypothetical protein